MNNSFLSTDDTNNVIDARGDEPNIADYNHAVILND